MSTEVSRWGDDAQYLSAPIRKIEGSQVTPQARLLTATPDPLGAIAAVGRMFKGIPTYSLSDITDEERMMYWEETFKSHLRAPHEFVQFHFFVEGVTRSHTHQMVRQRTATFAQESLRFAVKENLAEEIPMPPSVQVGSAAAEFWTDAIKDIELAYTRLVNAGIPAEDARGLLPHATTTRLHWRTNLNDLLHHAGNRLCTQAQFEWRILMLSVMEAIRTYSTNGGRSTLLHTADGWQFEEIARPQPRTFAPICYHTGKCEFKAIFDRPCTIQSRVDEYAANGTPSTEWTGIKYEEWLLDPSAAR